jgi:hypothetical protein
LHNEALQVLDIVVAAAVEEAPRASPPAAPAEGSCYIVAASATGEWAGKDNSLAAFSSGGWRYVTPTEGLSAYVKSTGIFADYRAGAWEAGNLRGASLLIDGQQVVGSRAAPIADPAGGSTIDAEARAAIVQLLATMRQHGLIDM